MKYTYGYIKGTEQKASNHMQHHRDIHFESQILELDIHFAYEFPIVRLLVKRIDIREVCLSKRPSWIFHTIIGAQDLHGTPALLP